MAARSEWSTVFERFPAGRVPLVGPIGIFLHDWSKPEDGHPRLFDHAALEILTTAHPRLVASVYSLSVVVLLALGVRGGVPPAGIAMRLLAGAADLVTVRVSDPPLSLSLRAAVSNRRRARVPCRTACITRTPAIRIVSCSRSS